MTVGFLSASVWAIYSVCSCWCKDLAADLAKKYSKDEASASNGGDLGYFDLNEMVDEFSDAVKELKVDEYTKEPVKSSFGYHIILKTGEKEKPKLKDVKFDKTSEYILIENPNSCYGFAVLWLKDRKNKIYEYDGFGHSGACSVVCSLLQKLREVENE